MGKGLQSKIQTGEDAEGRLWRGRWAERSGGWRVRLRAFGPEPPACGWRERGPPSPHPAPDWPRQGPFPSGPVGLTGNPPPAGQAPLPPARSHPMNEGLPELLRVLCRGRLPEIRVPPLQGPPLPSRLLSEGEAATL